MIFGREPAAIVGAIQSALALAISFGWLSSLGLSTEDDLAVVMAVAIAASAVYMAWATDETLLAPVIGLFKAILTLGAIYGLSLTEEQTGMIVAFITSGFALYQRTQVSPLRKGTFAYISPGDTRTPKHNQVGATDLLYGIGCLLVATGVLLIVLDLLAVIAFGLIPGIILTVLGIVLIVVSRRRGTVGKDTGWGGT